MRSGLATQVEQMLEARVADVRGAPAAPLEERVGGDCRSVREPGDTVIGADRSSGLEHRLLLARGRRNLGRPDPSFVHEHGVGERPSDVDAQDRHGP
jgi:hypothetical protein